MSLLWLHKIATPSLLPSPFLYFSPTPACPLCLSPQLFVGYDEANCHGRESCMTSNLGQSPANIHLELRPSMQLQFSFNAKSHRVVNKNLFCILSQGAVGREERLSFFPVELRFFFHQKCENFAWCLVAQLCPTPCNPMDCSPPDFSVHGNSPGKNTAVGCHALLQGIFPTLRSNPGLLHYKWILYQLSHQGSSYFAFQFSSVTHSVVSDSLRPHESQHARPPCPSATSRVHPNPHPLSRWCHPTISSSVVPFSSCLQSFPASGSFPMSQLFTSGGQSIGVSASTSVLPVNIQDWSPLGWTGWISLCPRDSQESSPTPQFKSTNSSVLSLLYSPTLISIHEHWKKHTLD